VADYTGDYEPGKDYMKVRYPITGWGQVFQPFFVKDNLVSLKPGITADSVAVIDRAHGGRSTRTFFQEGRWRYVYEHLKPGDYVLMQFGHNDSSEKHTERYVNIEGYKEFLRLFVTQTKQKGANPIILTPVARNYPWKDGKLQNVHGEYWQAPIDIAMEMNVPYIDLNKLSMEYFTRKGEDFTTNHYFMNLPENTYEAYPKGQKDNTHFQPEGAKAVASLVYQELKKIVTTQKK
jgi:lysophospholipase L1-like esterase